MTKVEWLAIIAIAVVLIAVMWPRKVGVADGDYQLILSLAGTTQPRDRIRVAIGWGQAPSQYLTSNPEIPPNWHDLSDWDGPYSIRSSYSYKLKTDWLGRFQPSPAVFQRMALVEYTAANQSPTYRVIPFERIKGQKIVEVSIPREPPSEKEAWRPDAENENTGR